METIEEDQKIVRLSEFAFQSTTTNDLDEALAKAQAEFKNVSKKEEGYGYNYASLAETIEVTKEILSKHGLSVQQTLGNSHTSGSPSVTTILRCKGQFVGSTASAPLIEMKGVNDAQKAGAVYSYLRRYMLQGILGLASEDNDASSEGTKKKGTTSFSKTATTATKPSGQKFRRKKTTQATEHEI